MKTQNIKIVYLLKDIQVTWFSLTLDHNIMIKEQKTLYLILSNQIISTFKQNVNTLDTTLKVTMLLRMYNAFVIRSNNLISIYEENQYKFAPFFCDSSVYTSRFFFFEFSFHSNLKKSDEKI